MEIDLLIFGLGIFASVIGYALVNFLLKPYLAYRDVVFQIGSNLGYYSHIITSPGSSDKLSDEAQKVLRKSSFDLQAAYLKIPVLVRLIFVIFRLIPSDEDVSYASGSLIFLHNSVHISGKTDENYKELQNIFTKLNIRELKNRYNLKRR